MQIDDETFQPGGIAEKMNRNQNETRIASPARTKQILQQHGIKLKKSLGQNFLTDANILRKIAAAANLTQEHGVLEVGPGIGALTEHLAESAGKVVAVEIDQRFIPVLKDVFSSHGHVEIVHGDILKLDLEHLLKQHFSHLTSVHAVANLPYYITTPILLKLLHAERLENIVVMIQKEVADRLAAKPGSKDYGSLSIAVQYYSEPDVIAHVPPSVFIPPPQVASAVIRLRRRKKPLVQVKDEAFFFDAVRAAFAQRRKTIYNNWLNKFYGKEDGERLKQLLIQAEIDPSRRGETLSIEEFARICDFMHDDLK